MATVLSNQIIDQAIESVKDYISTVKGLYSELDSTISTLVGSGFVGEAADGYVQFFRTKATPALVDSLTEADSITAEIISMLDEIRTQLIGTVDVKLGEFNQNPEQSE